MKIKTKLSLGVGFLFFLIILLIGVSVKYIHQLSSDTQNILVANYNTIDYVRQMLISLDEDVTSAASKQKFQENLKSQQKNITEPGEHELTTILLSDYEKLLAAPHDSSIYISLRKDLSAIMMLNMEAIQRKSAIAAATAKAATTVIAITGTICFLLAFTLWINLPGNVANPIQQLTDSIKEIAAENYSQRVHFEKHNEFGELAKSFNTMAEKLEEYNNSNLANLMMQKKRIEMLINNMQDPVIGLDENQKVVFINNIALKIAGLKLEDTIGKNAQHLALHNDLIRLLMQQLLLPNHATLENKPLKIFADDKESYFEKEFIKIEIKPTAENILIHVGDVILLKNITPFKELDVAKTNFIATVSHELKTPIAAIKMSLKLLNDSRVGTLNDEQKELAANIGGDAERLLKITGELLDLTQVESGHINLQKSPVEPKAIIEYAYHALRFHAEQKQITINIQLENELPMINCDMEKTAWVMVNFLSNAIRHSPESSNIQIEAKKNIDNVIFSVKDSGKGIDAKFKDRIFEKFYQIPNTETGKTGTGLGLAISKDFIEAQGGKIWMESELNDGSKFSFSIPAIPFLS